MELALLGKHTVAEYVSILEESLQLADQMVQMIVSLRDFAESSAPAGPPQSVALEAIVREIQAEMQGLADAREIRFRLTAEGSPQVSANPGRLREALQNLLVWLIHNSAGGDFIETEISSSNGEAVLTLTPPRVDLQYLQIKVLEDIANPGLLFSHASKNEVMGWAINRRLVDSLGGKLEIVTEGPSAACIRARLPLTCVT
jgi:signal transduction histidine kinase